MYQKGLLDRFVAEAQEKGLDPVADKEAVSKYLRQRTYEEFHGEVPSSVLWINKQHDEEDPRVKELGAQRVGKAEGQNETDMYGAQKAKANHLSMFEGRLAEFVLRLWSDPGDTVLDPFAGRVTRLSKAAKNGRRYLGFDVDPETCEENRQVAEENGWTGLVDVRCANLLTYEGEVPPVDFVFTCPPYWNTEFYGDNGEGLEGCASYTDFLEELVANLLVAADYLKEGGYLALVVKDFHYSRQQFSFHSDLIRGLTAGGLVQWDCVAKKMSTMREMFHRDVLQHRRTAQTHEYLLVFTKSQPKKAGDQVRKSVYRKNEKRKLEEERLKQRREQVLRDHGVDPKSLHPFHKYQEV